MVEKIGEYPWKGLYSLVSFVALLLIILGYDISHLDSVLLYSPAEWLRGFSLLLLIPVFILVVAAYFPGRIKAATKHPLLLSTMLWAIAHLMSNGTIVDAVLFGSFLVWAIWDRISLESRQTRPTPGAPESKYNDIVACVVGIGLYLVFVFWLHETIIGVPVY